MLDPLPVEAPVILPVVVNVQENVVDATLLDKTIALVEPEHKLATVGVAVATGLGFTTTFVVLASEIQLPLIALTV